MNLPEPGLWDRDAAIRAMAGDETAALQLFRLLLDGLEQAENDLQQFLHAADWHGIQQLAHRLQGSSRLCCTPLLDELMQGLECAAAAAQADRIAALLDAFRQLSERLRQQVSE